MTTKQEPKYKIENGQLVNRHSGEAIPDDEPVFVLRSRDVLALDTLKAYWRLTHAGTDHAKAVAIRLDHFEQFKRDHSERMKLPDTVLTDDWKP